MKFDFFRFFFGVVCVWFFVRSARESPAAPVKDEARAGDSAVSLLPAEAVCIRSDETENGSDWLVSNGQ